LRVPDITALQNLASTPNLVKAAPARSLARPEELERAETTANTPAISPADTSIANASGTAASDNNTDQRQTGYIEMPRDVDAYTVSQTDSNPAIQPDALQSASVIDLSKAQDTQAITEISEPYSLENRTEENASPTTPIDSNEAATAGQTESTANTSVPATAKSNEATSMQATGLGVLLGILMTGLLLGRKFLLSILPARAHRNSNKESSAVSQKSKAPAKRNDDVVTEPPAGTMEMPEPQLAVASGEVTSSSAVNEGTAEIQEQGLDSAANVDADFPEAVDSPRINLHESTEDSQIDFDMSDMEEPLEQTKKYSAPANASSAEDASGVFDHGTMRNLFSPSSINLDDGTPTTDLPNMADTGSATELPNMETELVDIESTSSLQTLSETVGIENPDDHLSKTLTQALGLLERDYEDEMTASQILAQKDINEALAKGSFKH
jgi:hypothetical protein